VFYYYEGIGIPGRYDDFPNLGTLISKIHFEIYSASVIGGFSLEEGCKEWLTLHYTPESSKFRQMSHILAENPPHKAIGNLEYNPSNTNALQKFFSLKTSTHCLFAAKSRIWSCADWNSALSFEANIVRSVPALIRFMISSRYEHLDGFVWEFPDGNTYGNTPEKLGETMYQLLTALGKYDPSGERVMNLDLNRASWQFRFNHQRIFVTSFAPCYPSTSPRHAFGSQSVWILFQPEFSFSYHNIEPSNKPGGTRDKTRQAFTVAGRPYHIPSRHDLMGHLYVRPMDELSDSTVNWWPENPPNIF